MNAQQSDGLFINKMILLVLVLILACLVLLVMREREQTKRDTAARTSAAEEQAAGTTINDPPATNPRASPFRGSASSRPKLSELASVADTTETSETRPDDSSATAVPVAVPAVRTVGFTSTALGGFTTPESHAGTVRGRVLLRGKPPAEKQIVLDTTCGKFHPRPLYTRHFVVGASNELANVFVYVKSGMTPTAPPETTGQTLDQVECEYIPYVTGMQAGQKFAVRNSDSVVHTVHSVPSVSGNPAKNVSQSKKGATTLFMFPKPEVFVKFKCDIHPWMFAYVGVVDHPWFAVTDRDGNFELPPNLPPGDYTLSFVHLKLGTIDLPLRVGDEPLSPLTISFDVNRLQTAQAR